MEDQHINFQVNGKSDKTIILVHGLPSSLQEWGLMSDELVLNGYRSIALDLPGHGDSFKPKDPGSYTADGFYAYFQRWMESLEIDQPPVLIGHSFGGYLCIRYALEHPNAVRGLILISPFLSSHQLIGMTRLVLYSPTMIVNLLSKVPGRMMRFFVWAGSLSTEQNRIRSSLSTRDQAIMTLAFKKFSPNVVFIPQSVNDISANILKLNIPTLLIRGDKDTTLSAPLYEQFLAKLPNSTHKVVGRGHYPQLTHFKEVTPSILEYLQLIYTR